MARASLPRSVIYIYLCVHRLNILAQIDLAAGSNPEHNQHERAAAVPLGKHSHIPPRICLSKNSRGSQPQAGRRALHIHVFLRPSVSERPRVSVWVERARVEKITARFWILCAMRSRSILYITHKREHGQHTETPNEEARV